MKRGKTLKPTTLLRAGQPVLTKNELLEKLNNLSEPSDKHFVHLLNLDIDTWREIRKFMREALRSKSDTPAPRQTVTIQSAADPIVESYQTSNLCIWQLEPATHPQNEDCVQKLYEEVLAKYPDIFFPSANDKKHMYQTDGHWCPGRLQCLELMKAAVLAEWQIMRVTTSLRTLDEERNHDFRGFVDPSWNDGPVTKKKKKTRGAQLARCSMTIMSAAPAPVSDGESQASEHEDPDSKEETVSFASIVRPEVKGKSGESWTVEDYMSEKLKTKVQTTFPDDKGYWSFKGWDGERLLEATSHWTQAFTHFEKLAAVDGKSRLVIYYHKGDLNAAARRRFA